MPARRVGELHVPDEVSVPFDRGEQVLAVVREMVRVEEQRHVTAGQRLQEIPWERPRGVKPGDTGGTLRTTMEEVKAEDLEEKRKNKG